MTQSQNPNSPSTPTQSSTRLPRPFTWFDKAKLIFWSFLIGAFAGICGGGYVVYNADKLNLPFLARGNNNSQATNTSNGNQTGDRSSGNAGMNLGSQAGGGNAGTVGSSNIGGNSGLGDISASGNAKIDIRIEPSNPQFQNDKLPGYFPDKGFERQPPQLTEFNGAQTFTRDVVLAGDVEFGTGSVVIRGKTYSPVFYLQGSEQEVRRVALKLDGKQKGALFQFGVRDLNAGDTNLTYQVNILGDGVKIWSGRVIYGTPQQILSVPLSIPNVTTVQIEYIIAQNSQPYDPHKRLNLHFTRAELLYK